MIAILILPAAEGHDIYSGLMDRLGESSCCDERDCRPAHYRVTSAGVEMLLDDEWVGSFKNETQSDDDNFCRVLLIGLRDLLQSMAIRQIVSARSTSDALHSKSPIGLLTVQ